MKILYALPFFYPYEIGGTEISTRMFAKKIAKTHKVIIFTINFGNRKDSINKFENMIVYKIGFPIKNKSISVLFDSLIFHIYLFLKMISLFRKVKIDIVHIQSLQMFLGIFLASKFRGKKVVVTIRDHGYDFSFSYLTNIYNRIKRKKQKVSLLIIPYLFITHLFNRRFTNLLIKKCDRIIAISNFMASKMIKKGVSKNKIKVVYVPAPEWKIHMKDKNTTKTTFLYVGQLDVMKGVDILIEAFKLLERKNKNVKLLLIGNGRKVYYEKISKKYGIENIKFLGKIDNKKLVKYYINSDCVIIPSLREEPLGRVMLEALSTKRFIITTGRGGLKEGVINGYNGLIVNNITPIKLMKAMEFFIFNKSKLRKNIEKVSKMVLKRFNIDTLSKRLILIYRELMET